jgi:hypothetical protein
MEFSFAAEHDPVSSDAAFLTEAQSPPEPTIEPGQVWVAETHAVSLSAFHSRVLLRTNVVLYERSLAGLVARVLPIGGYAEPLPAGLHAGPAVAPRAVQFAADGWSVLQLVEAGGEWRRAYAAERLNAAGGATLPLSAIGTVAAGRYRPLSARFAGPGFDRGAAEPLTLIFARPGTPFPMHGRLFTANGLAG